MNLVGKKTQVTDAKKYSLTQYMLVYCIMCLPFGVYFQEIWYIDGWVFVNDPMHTICKIGCILGDFAQKAPDLA